MVETAAFLQMESSVPVEAEAAFSEHLLWQTWTPSDEQADHAH